MTSSSWSWGPSSWTFLSTSVVLALGACHGVDERVVGTWERTLQGGGYERLSLHPDGSAELIRDDGLRLSGTFSTTTETVPIEQYKSVCDGDLIIIVCPREHQRWVPAEPLFLTADIFTLELDGDPGNGRIHSFSYSVGGGIFGPAFVPSSGLLFAPRGDPRDVSVWRVAYRSGDDREGAFMGRGLQVEAGSVRRYGMELDGRGAFLDTGRVVGEGQERKLVSDRDYLGTPFTYPATFLESGIILNREASWAPETEYQRRYHRVP